MWNTPLVRIYRIILWDLFLLCLIAMAVAQTTLLIGYLYVLPLHAAPIPPPRPPVTDVLPGTYSMKWGDSLYLVTLSESGDYLGVSVPGGESKWYGKWGWDPRTRKFYLREKCDSPWRTYDGYMDRTIHLDMTLRGRTSRGYYDAPDPLGDPSASLIELRRLKVRK